MFSLLINPCLNLYSNLLYNIGQDFLGIQYMKNCNLPKLGLDRARRNGQERTRLSDDWISGGKKILSNQIEIWPDHCISVQSTTKPNISPCPNTAIFTFKQKRLTHFYQYKLAKNRKRVTIRIMTSTNIVLEPKSMTLSA